MATPFSRTLRSLELDSSNDYISQIGLLVTIFLAIFWGYWFFTAPMLAYEVSHEVSVTNEEDTITRIPQDSVGAIRPYLVQRQAILAKFPAAVIKNLRPGQTAFLRLEGTGKQRGAIPAVVVEVIDSPSTGQGTVKLYIETEDANALPLAGSERGEVSIERNRGVPAHFVLRASGLLTETPPVSVSPPQRYLP